MMPKKGGSSGGGGSKSSRGGGVDVRGYYRSNGTYVAGHTRSSPSCSGSKSSSVSSSAGSSAGHGTTPSRGSSASSMAHPGVVHVSDHTKADGTYVSPHTRSTPSRGSKSPSMTSGTSNPASASSKATDTPKVYVDNGFNRKHGRVGKPIGSCVISKKSDRCKILKELEGRTVEDLRDIVQKIIDEQNYSIYEGPAYALDVLEQEKVEEKWKAMDVDPSTDIARLSTCHVQEKPIARSELQLEKNKIGQGGFGAVYAGLWHETPIAFKKLHYQGMSKKHQESFTTEVAVLAALNHPNVVKMFGVVVETNNIGIVMEYCTNRSLFHAIFIICTVFSEKKKIEIVTQVASAVKYLHNHDPKIAHCDIKSENILLDKDNNAKLSDFGLSTIKNTTESSQSNVGVSAPGKGTPRYSAPEVLRGEILKSDKLFPTDIYSLSIVVVEVVLEEEAYEELSVRQLEANVGTGDLRPTLPDTLPKQVVDLLQNSWHSDPSERPTAIEFHARWREISSLTS